MKLTKTIPARKLTVNFIWWKKDYSVYGELWRNARKDMKKKFDKCFWCNKDFIDGQSICIACVEGSGNKTICPVCAELLIDPQNDLPTTTQDKP